MDFMLYSEDEKFDTIIGNPPYVDNSLFDVYFKTNIKLKANLYLYFIEKCLNHLNDRGELIFIVPREFIKLTSAGYVNSLLYKMGTITHYYDYGDKKLFSGATPNVCIFRFEKSNFTRKTKTFFGTFTFAENNGIISFTKGGHLKRLGDIFDIKVGAVAGNDYLFENEDGEDIVFSKTSATGKTKKMIMNRYHPSLEKHKDTLIKRRIKKFDEDNWWEWGRMVDFRENSPRIYVNVRTRRKNPFFTNDCYRWDGSVLALFPKDENMDLNQAVGNLNSINWSEIGFVTGGRFCFGVKSLREARVKWID